MTPIAILGGVGSGAIVAQAIADAVAGGAAQRLIGFLNDQLPVGTQLSGVPVLGTFESWRDLAVDVLFISAIHKAGQMAPRADRVLALGIPDSRWAVVRHPRAVVADDAAIGLGSYFGPNAVVMPGARIGRHATVRAGAYVSHDAVIGDWVFIGPSATVSGRARIAEGAHLGPNAAVREDTSIGRFAVVGIGAVVLRDVPDGAVMLGNPARRVDARHAAVLRSR